MKHLLKKHRMLSVGIFLAAVLSIIYAAILSRKKYRFLF